MTEKSSLLAPNASVARKHRSSQVSLFKEASGFNDSSFPNVMQCDVYIHKDLYANAVLTGDTAGSNRFPSTTVMCSWVESRKVIWSWVESQVTRHDEGIFKPALV